MKYFTDVETTFERPRDGDAGYDLYATDDYIINPGDTVMIKTGLHVAIPKGYVGLICERSSMGKRGIAVRGGVIDESYRGEVGVLLNLVGSWDFHKDILDIIREFSGVHEAKSRDMILWKEKAILNNHAYKISKGDKIAQLLIVKISTPKLSKAESLESLGETARGGDGFGSTGQ